MEYVFEQMDEINNIFISGTAIALGITAILGIFLATNDYKTHVRYEETSPSHVQREFLS